MQVLNVISATHLVLIGHYLNSGMGIGSYILSCKRTNKRLDTMNINNSL